MNKTGHAVQNPIENAQKESLHGKKKSGPSRGYQNEAHAEDFDRIQGHYSKVTPHFDCSNLDVFFGGRPNTLKPATEVGFIGKFHTKKKSNDTATSKESHLRHPSSKDYSNFDELVEDTTIINNPIETKLHSSKKSNEIPMQKLVVPSEDASDLTQATFLEAALFKNHNKKKSREKSFGTLLKGGMKEEKTEQEIPEEVSKVGLEVGSEEQEKADMTSFKDIKVTKNNMKVLERIKSKALPSHSRFGSITGAPFEPIKPVVPTGQLESRTNNNSVFAGVNVSKLTKAVSPIILQYRDQEIYNDDTRDQNKLINEIFENPKNNGNSEDIPLDKSKEISHDDLNPRLLTEKTGSKSTRRAAEINFDSSKGDRKKSNLSLTSTDSTIDSENFNFPHDPHNNSFSTPFSGASGSFNNSGKLDFNSPVRIDSGRINSEQNSEINYMKSYSMQKNLNMMIPRMSMIPTQRMSSNNNLNQSCMSFCGGYGSSNNSDNSANLSFSEEYLNGAFNSSFNTPQGRQQPTLFNQSFNVPSNSNIMEQFYIAPQSLNDSANFRNNSFNMNQSVSNQDRNSLTSNKGSTPANSDSKNASSRMRRKTQEAEDGSLYEINLNRVDNCGRTTLMVRNIPNKYDLTLILQTIDKNHKGKYDFFYLPIDFSNRCNFGYAFINFINTSSIKDFYQEFNGKKWEKFNSEKICEIKYARIQGNTALMQHFQYSRVMNQQDKKLRPYIPPKYGFPNKQKLEELVRQQKLESAKNFRDKKAM